jgi:hypothetical protein
MISVLNYLYISLFSIIKSTALRESSMVSLRGKFILSLNVKCKTVTLGIRSQHDNILIKLMIEGLFQYICVGKL